MSFNHLFMKKGDRLPTLTATLTDVTGAAVDLEPAVTVQFRMANVNTDVIQVNAAATSLQNGNGGDGTKGDVQYEWGVGDTTVPGVYRAEFKVTFSDGKVASYPNDDYFYVTVFEDIRGYDAFDGGFGPGFEEESS